MLRSERDEWVKALRSGEYEQATGYLQVVIGKTDTGEDRFGFCCLGVKCDLDVKAGRHGILAERPEYLAKVKFAIDPVSPARSHWTSSWTDTMPSADMLVAWGMNQATAERLAEMNDGEHDTEQHTFAQIADWIDNDENVPVVAD